MALWLVVISSALSVCWAHPSHASVGLAAPCWERQFHLRSRPCCHLQILPAWQAAASAEALPSPTPPAKIKPHLLGLDSTPASPPVSPGQQPLGTKEANRSHPGNPLGSLPAERPTKGLPGAGEWWQCGTKPGSVTSTINQGLPGAASAASAWP